MKRIITLFILVLFAINIGYAQDEEKPKKKKDRPVTEMFGGRQFIDEQTTFVHPQKTLEMQIEHRFGLINSNGISDLFGIYAPSANTRIGLTYSLLDNLEVGYGITRKNMYSDFHIKWDIIRQTRKNTIPLDIAIYANMAIDGRNKDVFNTSITADSAFKFSNRLSYFTQVIFARKFTDWFSFGVSGSFAHYNAVKADTANIRGMDHDKLGIGFMGRFKFSPESSLIISYSIPLYIKSVTENTTTIDRPLANFSIGYEVVTASHVFQVFFTTSNGIIPQDSYLYNTNDWTNGEFRIGFNITRFWGFGF